jgi:hypothetical protein
MIISSWNEDFNASGWRKPEISQLRKPDEPDPVNTGVGNGKEHSPVERSCCPLRRKL